MKIQHRFVECIPDSVDSGVLYISISYATAIHLCVCGCGKEVVTPFTPTDWKLIFDGETVSLTPSIGNWSFPCRSHYFIKRNRIEVAGKISQQTIGRNREYDRRLKNHQYRESSDAFYEPVNEAPTTEVQDNFVKTGFISRMSSFLNSIIKSK
jgi:hypothetical protein